MDIEAAKIYHYGVKHTDDMVSDLSARAYLYRQEVLKMVYQRQSGHLGGAFSLGEILTALYFHHLRVDPVKPEWISRDRLLLSKGHACAMLYAVMAYRGFFSTSALKTFRDINSKLQGHPEPQKTPGIEIPSGPLGHGVAIGAGIALTAKLDKFDYKTYVILGDGEINAGVIWEGALVAAKYQLDNLKVILDYNGVQQTGPTSKVLSTEPISDKWKAFGWHVIECHGHNMTEVLNALDEADEIHAKPSVIIARTTKGKGVSFMENDPKWHGAPPNEAEYNQAMSELKEKQEIWNI